MAITVLGKTGRKKYNLPVHLERLVISMIFMLLKKKINKNAEIMLMNQDKSQLGQKARKKHGWNISVLQFYYSSRHLPSASPFIFLIFIEPFALPLHECKATKYTRVELINGSLTQSFKIRNKIVQHTLHAKGLVFLSDFNKIVP